MEEEKKSHSSSVTKNKKPGPRPTKCLWCGSTECTHCRCAGQNGCNHKKGEMCTNQRYKRRLVCNSCEKNKLREKQQMSVSTSTKRKRSKAAARPGKKKGFAKPVLKPLDNIQLQSNDATLANSTIPQPPFLNYDVLLTNRNSVIGKLRIQGNAVVLSAIRPHIVKFLETIEESSDFVFNHNNIPLTVEQESQFLLSDVTYMIDKTAQVAITLTNQPPNQLIIPQYSEMPNQLSPDRMPSVSSMQSMQSMQSMPSMPSMQSMPSLLAPAYQPFIAESPLKFGEKNWGFGHDTPVQRSIQEAKRLGKLDAIINQGIPLQSEFTFDDRPRDLQMRGDSYTNMGSYDNFYSRPGSMIFHPSSRPGSLVFNFPGSNLSLDGTNQYDDLVSNLHKYGDDGINRGAPSI